MQWLCNHEDQNMQRMAVAIISILAAKVHHLFIFSLTFFFLNYVKLLPNFLIFMFCPQLSTEQTAQLGAELFIVKV